MDMWGWGWGGAVNDCIKELEWKPDLCLFTEIVFPNALVQCFVAVY